MESLSLSRSVVNNLNATLYENTQIQRHLQTGRKIINNYEDSGGLGSITRLNSTVLRNQAVQQNLQGSLSLLQAQDGMFKVIGNILDRSAELKTKFSAPTASISEKGAYDEVFTELQNELRQIAESKWNGISLFSTQSSKVLFGEAVNTDAMRQESHDDGSSNTLNLSRWGIYHGLSEPLEAGDKFPTGFGENPPKNFLAFTLTDESRSSEGFKAYHGPHHPGPERYDSDLENWKDFIGEYNLDAKIAAVVVQQSAWHDPSYGGPKDGGALLPYTMTEPDDLPPFAKAYRGMVRESGGQDPYSETEAVDFLKDAFMDITNGATELPDAMGFFVDNSGSTAFTQVNQALISFKQWVETNYGTAAGGNVATATRTDPKFSDPEGEDAAAGLGKTGWVQGIYLAGYENWIEQSQNAIKDMIANDPDIAAATEKGSLSDSNSGVKSMLDPVYALDDFDLEELNNFMKTLTTARAQNGAEQSRIKHELDELQTKQVGLEQALERADGLDYSLAMARYSKSRDQLHLTANLVSAAREMENVLYTDFLNE